MNYYEHHLGDWAAATGHLTWDEDMAYTRLLRAYYHHERAIPEGQQYRLAKASTPAQRKAVAAILESYATDAGTGTYHGMTAPETFRKVEISGIDLLFAEATGSVAKTVVTLMKTLKAMPEKFREATRKIVMTGQINKHEEYWNKTYDMAGSITGATGGDGEIVAYRDNELLAPTLAAWAPKRVRERSGMSSRNVTEEPRWFRPE